MKPSGRGLLFVGRFLITVLISVLVMGLFTFSISSSVLEGYTFLRICPYLPSCPFYWHVVVRSNLVWSLVRRILIAGTVLKSPSHHDPIWQVPADVIIVFWPKCLSRISLCICGTIVFCFVFLLLLHKWWCVLCTVLYLDVFLNNVSQRHVHVSIQRVSF